MSQPVAAGRGGPGQAPVGRLRVLVVDDSAVQRRYLRLVLDRDPTVSVVAEAATGEEAVTLVRHHEPDVVVLDLELPDMNGLQVIEEIMAVRPTPIVVHSAFVAGDHADNGAAALSAGAVDVVAKPGPSEPRSLEHAGAELIARVRTAARVRVITHPRGRLRIAGYPTEASRPAEPAPTPVALTPAAAVDLVVIGASTGGPQALAAILGVLPADFPAPVLVIQHIAAGFVPGLATWLASSSRMPVRVGAAGEQLQPGQVVLAPSGANLLVRNRLRIGLEPPGDNQHHVPGIDVTMRTVAQVCGPRALGVLLTGMGRDGAEGLGAMRVAGAVTLAQDEETSTVYGMPAAAVSIGAALHQLPLPEIGPAIARLAAGRDDVEAS